MNKNDNSDLHLLFFIDVNFHWLHRGRMIPNYAAFSLFTILAIASYIYVIKLFNRL